MTSYDEWKTRAPDDDRLFPQRDVCGRIVSRGRLFRGFVTGIETTYCEDCSRDPDQAREERRDRDEFNELLRDFGLDDQARRLHSPATVPNDAREKKVERLERPRRRA